MTALPSPLESAVAACCELLTALEQLAKVDGAPHAAAAFVTRLDELLDELTEALPAVDTRAEQLTELEAQVDELRAARETGDGLAQAAEQAAAAFVDRRETCACGEVELDHEDQLVYRHQLSEPAWPSSSPIHGNPVCVLERAQA